MNAEHARQVRPEQPDDADAVRAVHATAFGRSDAGCLVDALRERAAPFIGMVAAEPGAIVGHAAFSAATLHCYGALYRILALGPIAVLPELRRRGIGSALVHRGLDRCRALGHDVIVVLGDPGFYSRFGFVPARPRGVIMEDDVPDEQFMIVELSPGALRGRRGVVYRAAAFAIAGRPPAAERAGD